MQLRIIAGGKASAQPLGWAGGRAVFSLDRQADPCPAGGLGEVRVQLPGGVPGEAPRYLWR